MKAALLALGIIALLLVSCASPVPRHQAFEHFFEQYEQIAAPDLAKLDADYQAGLLTDLEYQRQRTAIRGNVQQKVNDLVLHNHRLRENDAQRLGLPIAGTTVATPTTGRGFGSQQGAGAASLGSRGRGARSGLGASGFGSGGFGASGLGGGGLGGVGGGGFGGVNPGIQPSGPVGLVY